MDRTSIIVVSTCIILFFLYGSYVTTPPQPNPALGEGNQSSLSSGEKIEVKVPGKTIFLDANEWFPMHNTQAWAKNYQAKKKKDGQAYETVLTIFLQTMTTERRSGKQIATGEYIKIFSLLPGNVKVQLRVDKGKYWILTSDTYEVRNLNALKVETDPLVYKMIYQEIQTKIDNNRFFIRNNL